LHTYRYGEPLKMEAVTQENRVVFLDVAADGNPLGRMYIR
jgi:hypothetical protein